MTEKAFSNAFGDVVSDEALDQLIECHPAPICLGNDTADVEMEHLRVALESVFQSSVQVRSIIRCLLAYGRAHASLAYPSSESYVKGLYSLKPWPDLDAPAVCITGLAGVGKSALLSAYMRLIDSRKLQPEPNHASLPCDPVWSISLKDGTSLAAMLGGHLSLSIPDSEGRSKRSLSVTNLNKKFPFSALMTRARRESWKKRTAVMCADEMQYITHGNANTKATAILLSLMGIGPRLFYAANFSLLHGLLRRHQQDTQRLLACPIVIMPECQGSADWNRYLSALVRACPQAFSFDVDQTQGLIHRLTYGIKRLVVRLLSLAYLEARKKNRLSIEWSDIQAAACSMDFYAARRDVEILERQENEVRMIREDLWCPFPMPDHAENGHNVVPLTDAVERFEERVEQEILLSSLTPKERERLEVDPCSSEGTLEDSAKKVVQIRKRKKPTKDDLINAMRNYEQR